MTKLLNKKIRRGVDKLIDLATRPASSFHAVIGDVNNDYDWKAGGNLVYVTEVNSGKVYKVVNNRVPNRPRRHVKVGFDVDQPYVMQILREWNVYGKQDLAPQVPNHHETHEWPGYDTTWIKGEQFMPGLLIPAGSFTVRLYGGVVLNPNDMSWILIKNQDIDLTSYIPANGARFVLLEAISAGCLVDDYLTVYVTEGDVVDSPESLTLLDIPRPSGIPLWAVRLHDGQEEIIKDRYFSDCIDLRSFNINNAMPALRIMESGGDTLEIEAITSGQYLRRVGNTITSGTPSGGSGSGGAFQRNLTADLVLEDGECLVIVSYLNQGGYDLILHGDADLLICDALP